MRPWRLQASRDALLLSNAERLVEALWIEGCSERNIRKRGRPSAPLVGKPTLYLEFYFFSRIRGVRGLLLARLDFIYRQII